jgi:hypothetical protein
MYMCMNKLVNIHKMIFLYIHICECKYVYIQFHYRSQVISLMAVQMEITKRTAAPTQEDIKRYLCLCVFRYLCKYMYIYVYLSICMYVYIFSKES